MSIKTRSPIVRYTYDGPLRVGMIPDTHWCPTDRKGSLQVAKALGKYYKEMQPDVIVHIGDQSDFGSLSAWDKGTAEIEGKRLEEELDFARECMSVMTDALGGLDFDGYHTSGNHRHRVYRVYNDQPALAGVLGDDHECFKEFGWTELPFRDMLELNGVYWSHLFQNPTSVMGSPIGGTIENCLKNLGHSFVQGHVQTLRMGQMHRGNGDIHCGLIAGACYTNDHGYKGPQGNYHWRGTCLLDNVDGGYYDLTTLGMKALIRDYG